MRNGRLAPIVTPMERSYRKSIEFFDLRRGAALTVRGD
jgi:hypothetical protein